MQVFNFNLTEPVDILKVLRSVLDMQKSAFKIEAKYGFISRNVVTDELRYHYPSNNTVVFSRPHFVSDDASFRIFVDALLSKDVNSYVRANSPNTKNVCHLITNLRLGVYPAGGQLDRAIGCDNVNIPPYVMNNRGLNALIQAYKTGRPYNDNFCVFRCLALNSGLNIK